MADDIPPYDGVEITESATVERFDTRPETMQRRVDFDTADEVEPAIEQVSVRDLPGYQMGYEKGYWAGYKTGYKEGVSSGWDKGYEQGRRDPVVDLDAEDGIFYAHQNSLDCGRTVCATCGRPAT